MSKWTIYDMVTGLIRQQLIDANGPLNDLGPLQLFVSGHYSADETYISGGTPVNRPEFDVTISNNEEPYATGKFRLDDIPDNTVITYDEETVTVTDGYFELTSLVEGTVPVTLTLFPYKPRTIDAIFTA